MTWRFYLHLNTEVSVSLMVFDNNDVLLFLAATFETSLSKKTGERITYKCRLKNISITVYWQPLTQPPTQLQLFAINFFIARIMPCLLAKATQWKNNFSTCASTAHWAMPGVNDYSAVKCYHIEMLSIT